MSTHQQSPFDPKNAADTGAAPALGGEEARRLLAEAEGRSRSIPAVIPSAFITYAILCVIGTFAVLGLHLAELVPATEDFSPRLLMIVFSLVWVAVAMIPLMLFRDRWRRGLGRRWIVLMICWGVLWAVGMILAGTALALVIAPLFLVLFVVAVAGEAAALKERSHQDAHQRAGRGGMEGTGRAGVQAR